MFGILMLTKNQKRAAVRPDLTELRVRLNFEKSRCEVLGRTALNWVVLSSQALSEPEWEVRDLMWATAEAMNVQRRVQGLRGLPLDFGHDVGPLPEGWRALIPLEETSCLTNTVV